MLWSVRVRTCLAVAVVAAAVGTVCSWSFEAARRPPRTRRQTNPDPPEPPSRGISEAPAAWAWQRAESTAVSNHRPHHTWRIELTRRQHAKEAFTQRTAPDGNAGCLGARYRLNAPLCRRHTLKKLVPETCASRLLLTTTRNLHVCRSIWYKFLACN